jgi:CarboxypepD_reg-like domain/TonB-dependent Receptor Plug Domain
MKYSISILSLLLSQLSVAQVRLSGYVLDHHSGEAVLYAAVSCPEQQRNAVANQYGYYTLTLPTGPQRLQVRAVGYQPLDTVLTLAGDTRLDIKLVALMLAEVVVKAPVGELQHNAATIPVERLKAIPMLMGQPDLIKALMFLPGVSAGTEGTTGLYVRGGTPDQNLILLDGATVYNAAHLFGFQSVFDPSAIKDIQFIKGGFPARYGGRLSSIVDITMKEGNNQQRHGEVTLGLINSGLMLEGPVRKGTSSYMASGRVAYPGLLLLPLYASAGNRENQPAATMLIYDVNLKFNHQFRNRDKLFVSMYRGSDNLLAQVIEDSVQYNSRLGWGNRTASVRYVREWKGRVFSNTLINYNFYQLQEQARQRPLDIDETLTFGRRSLVEEVALKQQVSGTLGRQQVWSMGFELGAHRFQPSNVSFRAGLLNLDSLARTAEFFRPVSHAVFVEDTWTPVAWLTAVAGLRWSGLRTSRQSYGYWEPRLSVTARTQRWSFQAGYARTAQFIHLLANNSLGLFSDLWVPSTDKVPPQLANQYTGGVIFSAPRRGLECSIEGYYKQLYAQIDYRQGVNFFANSNFNWQNTIETGGAGRTYGVEAMIRRERPGRSAWLSYTLSWSERQFANINRGVWYPHRYDRRHNLALTTTRALKRKWQLGTNFVYQTGSWVTMSSGKYDEGFDFQYPSNLSSDLPNASGGEIVTGRNNQRLPTYHRLDLSLTKNYLSKRRKLPAQFIISVYNAYARRNPYIMFFSGSSIDYGGLETEFKSRVRSQALFSFIPSLAYNIKW